jgi:hypothetical protein
MRSQTLIVCFLFSLVGFIFGPNAEAAFFSTSAAAGFGNSPWSGGGSASIGGPSSASYSTNFRNEVSSASASAASGLFSNNRLIRLSATANSPNVNTIHVASLGFATYSDRISSATNTNLGESLRLEFEISGVSDLQDIFIGGGIAELSLYSQPFFQPAFDLYGATGIFPGTSVGRNYKGLSQIGLTNFAANSSPLSSQIAFRGLYYVDAGRDFSSGEYGFYLTTRIKANAAGSSASMDVGNTITLLNVYNSEGQKVAFSDLTFASGARFSDVQAVQAVPEPTSLAIFAIGACGVGLARRRRREKQ